MPIFGRLEITDGTSTIDLLNNHPSGFLITDWQPAIPDLKAGGSWADPPTADERELIVGQLADVEEQFTFDVVAATPDQLIGYLRDLRAMLTKGRQYTLTEWQDTPVYLVAQGYQESNVRYTRVKNWRTPEDGNPYAPPMWGNIQGTSIDDYSVIIEHGAWTSNPPGTGTATEISAMETYDGRNLGNVDDTGARDPSSTNAVYVANKRNEANLTDIYYLDLSIPAFSANLMDAALPFTLLPAVPAAGDVIYFGIDTTVADSGPFSNLVFDLSVAGAGYTAIWEYWNGAWVALTVQDNTDTLEPLDTTGINSVSWVQPPDWTTLIINGVTGYWVQLRIVTAPGPFTVPTQQNRDIYSSIWPYIEIQSTDVGGDVPSLARIQNYLRGYRGGYGSFERLIVGLRSMDRGSDFTAFINVSDEQNPTGIVVADNTGFGYINNLDTATGRAITPYNWPFAGSANMFTIGINQALAESYRGTFRIFVRAELTAGVAAENYMYLQVRVGSSRIFTTPDIYFRATTGVSVLDFGVSNIVPFPGHPVEDISIIVFFGSTNTGTAVFYDVILIPVDEWAGDVSSGDASSGGTTMQDDDFLDIDPITVPKAGTLAYIRDDAIAGDPTRYGCQLITNGISMLQANAHQRLWFFAMNYTEATSYYYTYGVTGISKILLERNQRYYSMRGGS